MLSHPPDNLPVLSEVLELGRGASHPAAEPLSGGAPSSTQPDLQIAEEVAPVTVLPPAGQASWGGPAVDLQALEQRLVESLMLRFQGVLEHRVHTSVAPAVSMLADRIAYKAAQEVAADLAEQMREDLSAAVQQALRDVAESQKS